jgi:peptidoglycan/LPS O-acetylase OafA/YrhL
MSTSDTITPSRPGDQEPATRSTGGDRVGPRHYLPALDGLRAVAVTGVLLFHFGFGWLAGGILGVDVFFVLSGFLITSLLLQEWSASGKLNFGRFYAHRARRLLPALLLMVLLVAAYAAWFAQPDTLSSIRGDVLSAIGYFSNWHFVFSHQSYFVSNGPPSPVLHTWSLAVEEQFYLVWPAVTYLVLRRFGRRGLAVTASLGIAVSATATFLMSLAGVGTSRLYYGSDVRTQELMAGALLAIATPTLTEWSRRRRTGGRASAALLATLGSAGFVLLIWLFHSATGMGSFLYRGGFLLVAAATVSVISVVLFQPQHPLVRLLALPPARYVGRISYGLYLYHFPLFLILNASRTGVVGFYLLAIRLAATFTAAVLSYHLVELPIRNGKLFRRRIEPRRLLLAIPAGVTVGVIAVVLATAPPPTSLQPIAAASASFGVPSNPPPGLTQSHQVRVLLLGDSMALTLGMGLGQNTGAWGIKFENDAVLGCDLDPTSIVDVQNVIGPTPRTCTNWQTHWAHLVNTYDPDVVAVEVGRFEVADRLVNGHWSTVGQPAWDNVMASRLSQAIAILGQRGAKVVFFTLPYITQTFTMPNGQPWDFDRPIRTDQWNAVLEGVVAQHPRQASIIDLNRLLCPAGHYVSYIDGIRVRATDNEHISTAGGEFVRPEILPQLAKLGRAHAAARSPATPWFPIGYKDPHPWTDGPIPT